MSRRGLIVLALLLTAGVALAMAWLGRPEPAPAPTVTEEAPAATRLGDDFERPLDPARWKEFSEGDFKEKTVDLVHGRLRLRCGTIGTDDRTVKVLGLRSIPSFALRDNTRIVVDLDWNDQANGSYLSAALVLAPESVDASPLATPDWFKVEYVGVPPGRNGRLVVAQRTKGRELPPFTEGWPQTRREGRSIKRQHVELVVHHGLIEVWENGTKVHETGEKLSFEKAQLSLLMTSHSNYPPRELFFDNVRVSGSE